LTNAEFKSYLKVRKTLIDEALDRYLPPQRPIHPSFFRRPLQPLRRRQENSAHPLLAAAEAARGGGDDSAPLLPAACALELIHTYSLIHDDLPAHGRRRLPPGRPTCHTVFGEAMAILAATPCSPRRSVSCAPRPHAAHSGGTAACRHRRGCRAAGFLGMVGGQAADVTSEGTRGDEETLRTSTPARRRHDPRCRAGRGHPGRRGGRHDGAASSMETTSAWPFRSPTTFSMLTEIGALLGKGTGSDAARAKLTYPALLASMPPARGAASRGTRPADCEAFGPEADPLRVMARYIVEREM